MKYKCIKECSINGSTIMHPGDIIVISENKIYNITTSVDYKISDLETIKTCLEVITDDQLYITTDYGRFKVIVDEMARIFKAKNHDYGNSFEQSLNEEGIAASRIRIGDKWNRYKQLSKGVKAQVDNESIRDTLIDLANYSIMTVIWMDKQKIKQ